MGYDSDVCMQALSFSNNDFPTAIAYLLDHSFKAKKTTAVCVCVCVCVCLCLCMYVCVCVYVCFFCFFFIFFSF